MSKRKIINLLTLILVSVLIMLPALLIGNYYECGAAAIYFGILIFTVWYKVPEGPHSGFPFWMTTPQIWLAYIGSFVSAMVCVFAVHGQFLDKWWIHFIYLPLCISGACLYRYAYMKNAPKDPHAKYDDLLDARMQHTTYVVVAEFEDVESARVVRDMLIAKGIEARTFNEVIPAYISRRNQPVRVCVHKADKDIAERIINE